ncbi:hypothetical protein DAEQUDRAFT_215091 [Daedalea quercina L-15889]|uniref:Uncharacterized protein n=1 Tax=Daedalea quercina L-15889 TaxID=1314783 RepID=A0A165R3L8_9APHY|nr:hypothetical protein DAEQUDRAFT_215091 [Daedalea quercina L-15889]
MSSPPDPSAVSSPPTPPVTQSSSRPTSPSRSIRSRMGTVMRRTSTGLFNRASSAARKSDSKNDLKNELKVDPTPAPPESVPSPVAESPAREAAAAEQGVAVSGPHESSPLVNAPVSTPSASAEPSIAQVLQPAQAAASPEPMATAPTSTPANDALRAAPAIGSASASAPAPALVPASTSAPVSMAAPAPAPETQAAVVANNLVESPESQIMPLPSALHAPSVEKRGPDYFAWGDTDAISPNWKGKEQAPPQPQAEPAPAVPEAVVSVNQGHASAAPVRTTDAQAFAWKDDMTMPTKHSTTSLATGESVPQTMSSEPARTGGLSNKPSKSSMASSYGQVIVNPSRRRGSVSMDPNDGEARRGRSPGPSVRIAIQDPFADPVEDSPTTDKPFVKRTALSPIESINSPAPDMPAPARFPLPPQRDVIAAKYPKGRSSGYSLGNEDSRTDETETRREIECVHTTLSNTAYLTDDYLANAGNFWGSILVAQVPVVLSRGTRRRSQTSPSQFRRLLPQPPIRSSSGCPAGQSTRFLTTPCTMFTSRSGSSLTSTYTIRPSSRPSPST